MAAPLVAGLAGLLLAPLAAAQTAAEAELRMDAHGAPLPPAAPDAPLTLWPSAARPAGEWGVGVVAEEVEGALFLTADGERAPALTHLVGLNLGGSWQLTRHVGLAASLPIWLVRGVADGSGGVEPDGPAGGDLLLAVPVGLVGRGRDGARRTFGLQLVPALTLPTGNAGAHLGEDGATLALALTPGLHLGGFDLDGELGLRGRPTVEVSEIQHLGGPEWMYGLSGASDLGPVRVGLELRGAAPADGDPDPARAPAEALLVVGTRGAGASWARSAGGGGLSSGIGSPDFRGLVAAGWRHVVEAQEGGPVLADALTVTVVDPTGAPVAGATVTVPGADPARTDAQGRVTLPVERQALRRGATVEAPGFEPATVAFGDDGAGRASLAWRPVAVAARVQDQAGQPVTPTWEIRRAAAPGEPPGAWQAVQGPPVLVPGSWDVRITAPGAGAQIRRVDVRPGLATPIEVVVLPAGGDAGLALALSDPEGRPVVGARVLVDGQPVGISGAAGDLTVGGLAAGKHDLTVRSDAFTERRVDGVALAADTSVPVVLERVAGSVRVTVRGPDGMPATDAVLRFDGPSRLAPTPVGETGERTQVLGEGDWTLLVTSSKYGFQERSIHVPEDAARLVDVEIVLQPEEEGAGDLLVRVVDGDGVPVDGAAIALDGRPLGRTSTGGELRLERLDVGPRALAVEAPWHRPAAVPDLDVHEGHQERLITLDWVAGATEIVAHTAKGPVGDATARFTGPATAPSTPLGPDGREILQLAPGRWTALVTSTSAGFQETDVEIPEDGRRLTRIDALLSSDVEGAAKLVVHVTDPDGAPVDGALVRVDGEPAGITGNLGALTAPGVDPGKTRLAVEAPPLLAPSERTVTVAAPETASDVQLAWADGTAIVHVVDPAGKPVPDAVVRIDGPVRVPGTPTGADGTRRFALGAGAFQILATSDTLGFTEASVTLAASDRMKPVTVTMEPVGAGRAALLVRVRDPDGAPIRGARVALAGDERETGENGSILADDLPTGPVEVTVSAPGFAPAKLALDLEEGPSERFAELAWVPRTVNVAVKDPSGAPVDAELHLVGPEDRAPIRTGADGVEAVQLRPGTWQIIASTDTLGPSKSEIVVGERGADVTLSLEPSRIEASGERVVLKDRVNFELDRATLGSGSMAVLQQVASTLLARPDVVRVEVQGHTDDIGSVAYNQELSQKRAEAVVAALVELGVPKEELVAVGYGMQRPVVPNDTDEHRAENRRVAFELESAAKP